MSNFEKAYTAWLEKHKAAASGERLRRLVKHHGFGEKILLEQALWPVLGTLEHLHPEYEFIGSDGSRYFIDTALIRRPRPTAIESDSFSSHARDIDRAQFSRGLDRQNEMVLADWNILRFSVDKLKDNPHACQNAIRRMLVCWYGDEESYMHNLNIYQRELVRAAIRSAAPISIDGACQMLGKKDRFTRTILQSLVNMNLFEAASGTERVHIYQLVSSRRWG